MKPTNDPRKEREDLEATLTVMFVVGCILAGFVIFGSEKEQGQATGLFVATLCAFVYGASLLNAKGGGSRGDDR